MRPSGISFGYLLLLVSSIAFLVVLSLNKGPSINTAQFNVNQIDGRTWVDWERDFGSNEIHLDLTIQADYRLDLSDLKWYNFSTLPILVRITNEGNLTLNSFELQVLIEDQTGHIRGSGGASPRISSTTDRVVETRFVYNVPAFLRGQELKVHVVSFIQQILVVNKELVVVKTFPRLEITELPRILLFFLTFSTLPVSVFLPSSIKRRAEDWWRVRLKNNQNGAILMLTAVLIAFTLYWSIVCKVFGFL